MRLERLATPDGDAVHLYHHDLPGSTRRLFLLHGLEGSADSHYVRGFTTLAAERGWSTTLLVFRGCGPEFNSAPRLYHSGETTDLSHALASMLSRNEERFFLAGVSLGGNVLLKFLGEMGDSLDRRIVAAAAVSVPFDLEAGARFLQRGFAKVYDRHFLKSLKAKAGRKLSQHHGLFDPERLNRAGTIEAFDDAVTAPVHGFAGSSDYYRRSSSIHFLSSIRLPTLLLNSRDDPFLPSPVLNRVADIARANRCLTALVTMHGGHVGFVSGSNPFRVRHWAEERVIEFLVEHSGVAA
jgi:predicted alpha/beta-fold hydrolase